MCFLHNKGNQPKEKVLLTVHTFYLKRLVGRTIWSSNVNVYMMLDKFGKLFQAHESKHFKTWGSDNNYF